ncbi:MAG: hypothetical protein JST00_24540 [Deltaproteobacteria bacterium]|nr:hypothetical protein [Deltaproteobacteria bacterium]
MSSSERRDDPPETDDLIARLRALPVVAPAKGAEGHAARQRREARAAFVQAFAGERPSLFARIFASSALRNAAVPIALAGVVAVYMHWAATAALKVMQ